MSNSLIAIIQPKYESVENDFLEGLRINIGVMMQKKDNAILSLSDNCIDPFFNVDASNKGLVALSCVNETAADNLLHRTVIYQIPSKKILFEKDRCTNPKISSKTITCDEELLGEQGELQLKPKTFELILEEYSMKNTQ